MAPLASQDVRVLLTPIQNETLATHGDRESERGSVQEDERPAPGEDEQSDETDMVVHSDEEQWRTDPSGSWEEIVPVFTQVPEWMQDRYL